MDLIWVLRPQDPNVDYLVCKSCPGKQINVYPN